MYQIKVFFKLISYIGVSKTYISFVIFLILLSSFLDILSLGLIVPYVSTIFDVEQVEINYFLFDSTQFQKNEIILYLTIF